MAYRIHPFASAVDDSTETSLHWLSLYWGFSNDSGPQRPLAPVIAEEPTSPEDAENGWTCVQSGMWFPGHSIIETARGPVGAPFYAHDPEEGYN